MRLIIIVFAAVLCTLQITAQPTNLDTIAVSANRLPQKSYETGRDLVVLDKKAIQSIPAQSVDELLKYLPGVEVQSRGAFGVQSDLTIRGATFSQVLVLIDGIRLNDPLTAHFNGYVPVSMEEIERIEIMKGPAAAMYGADAMGGVINFITHTGNSDFGGENLDGRASVKVGENALMASDNGINYASQSVKASVGLQARESDGHPLETGGRGFFDMKTASGGLAVRQGNWQFYGRTGYDYRHFSAKNFYTLSTIDSSIETINNWWSVLRASRITEKDRTDVSFSYRNNNDVFDFNPALIPANEHTTQQYIAQVDHQHIINDDWQWQAGVQGTRRTIESTDRGDHETNHLGVYGMSQWNPVDRLSLNGSLRMDADENYGVEVTPQLSIAYWLDQLVLRATGGRSIRAADFTERYISTNIPGPLSSGRNLGNADLNAEKAWSSEIGVEWFPLKSPKLAISASGFYRNAENVIDYLLTPASEITTADNLASAGEYLYASNIANVTTFGLDAHISYTQHFDKSYLRAKVGWLLQDIQTNLTNPSKYITNQARSLVTAHAVWSNPYFQLGISGLYKQRPSGSADALGLELTGDYTVWNVEASVNLFEEKVHVTGSVMNVFDEQYSDILGAQMPGRWIMGGLRFDI